MTKCPNQNEAFIWGGGMPECLMHYTDHSVFGKLDLPHGCIEYGGNLTKIVKSNLTEFDQICVLRICPGVIVSFVFVNVWPTGIAASG
ncbi:hypothetical protein Dsin_014862 [Dipteronia sinensis]|uniref:Uncharacterized protein n=1 Tax=Dipteronia sinensis TaxID=43782 RepID=A0AAE0AN09_9ROSI|nr:hypothetical protein Dsin_014862 [Dipteronia sinensis]